MEAVERKARFKDLVKQLDAIEGVLKMLKTEFDRTYGHLQKNVVGVEFFLTGWSYAFGARLPAWLEYDYDG